MKSYRYLPVISGIFAATLVITNLLNSKIFMFLGYALPAGIITFPLTFLAGDALTEVYGYAKTRQVIWTGFIVLIFMAAMVMVGIQLEPAPFWPNQKAFESILDQVPRIVAASILAYFAGEFCNSYVLAKIKVAMNGRSMPIRFIGSTMVGQAVDTVVFMTIAFAGVYPAGMMVKLFLTSWVFKVVWEFVALPISVPFVKWLKRAEHEDHYDRATNFSPFQFKAHD